MQIRKVHQQLRVFRVYALAKYYADFRDIYLNECLLKTDNNYQEAERISHWINVIFKGETVPTDFISNHDELVNDLIDKVEKFNNELDYLKATKIGLTKELVLAFCKNVEHQNFHILKINISFYYQANYLFHYVNNLIDKIAFLHGIKETDIFNKTKKYNNIKFRKTFLAIEKTYSEIERKQNLRKYKNG